MRVAVFDVGGTFIKSCCMVDDEITMAKKTPTPYDSQETFLNTVEERLKEMEDIEGIAFSMPGVIDVNRKYIFAGGSLSHLNHTDVHAWEERFHLPITIENDARCAAIAELETGEMKGIQQGIVLTFGTGVGGGIIINGDIYKGSHLIAGEVSVIFSKDKDTYGSKGLFGAIGSIKNLVKEIADAKHIDTQDGEEVFDWIKQHDNISVKIFERYCREVIQELHNMQCLLDPQRICIGGGASENPVFIEGLKKASDEFYQGFPFKFPHADIVKCKYCNNANILGAYYHYKRNQL